MVSTTGWTGACNAVDGGHFEPYGPGDGVNGLNLAVAVHRPKKLLTACSTAALAGSHPNLCEDKLLNAAADALRAAMLQCCEPNSQSPLLLDSSACNSRDSCNEWGRPDADSAKHPPRLHQGSISSALGACCLQCRDCAELRAALAQQSAELESDHMLIQRAAAVLEQREAENAMLRSRVAVQEQQIQELLCRLRQAEQPYSALSSGAG